MPMNETSSIQSDYESAPLQINCIQQWATEQVILGVERSEKIANENKKLNKKSTMKSNKKQKKVTSSKKRKKKTAMEIDFIQVIRFIQSRVKVVVEQGEFESLNSLNN